MHQFRLDGAVAVVTGGNGGLGLAMAKSLAGAGADVCVWGRNKEKNEAAVDELRSTTSSKVAAVNVDVSSNSGLTSALEQTTDAFGPVTVLVNNAGISVRGPSHELTLVDFDRVIATNLRAAFACSQAVHGPMADGGYGKIINIGSLLSSVGSPFSLPYSVSKGGLVQLTQSLAAGWGSDGIRVNLIAPGWFDTELTRGTRTHVPGLHESVIERTPLGRWGAPTDLAGAVVFLASAASDFMTGSVLTIDGGYSGTI